VAVQPLSPASVRRGENEVQAELGPRLHGVAAFPQLVRDELIADGQPPQPFDYDVLPTPRDAAPQSGIFWKASLSTKEKGEQILEATVEGIIKVIEKEFQI
jgi:creatinine amidohydrolase/Fe(II)-dependent formamide hydrolase-like protein